MVERAGPVLPIIENLRSALPDETIVVDDLTVVGYWMPLLFDTHHPRTLIHPGTYGTLGYALPASIGAMFACPDKPVVSISGDGGFMFSVQDLATAVQAKRDLVALVFNDHAYGSIRVYQDRIFCEDRPDTPPCSSLSRPARGHSRRREAPAQVCGSRLDRREHGCHRVFSSRTGSPSSRSRPYRPSSPAGPLPRPRVEREPRREN